VLDLVPFEEDDESPFVGLLQVEAAEGTAGAASRSQRAPGAANAERPIIGQG
jgi:hypothetical protein